MTAQKTNKRTLGTYIPLWLFNFHLTACSFVIEPSYTIRVSSRKLYRGEGGGSSVIIMKGGHDQMQNKCGLCSKFECCEGMVEEFEGEVGHPLTR